MDKKTKNNLVIVDLGNKLVKVGHNISFENTLEIYNAKEQDVDTGECTLVYGNKLYIIGSKKVSPNAEYVKTEKEFIPQVLYAIATTTSYDTTSLMLVLPVDQFDNREVFTKTFKGKNFKFIVNGKSRTLKIENVYCTKESQSGFFSLSLEDRKGLTGILDWGSYTVNVFLASGGKEVQAFTINGFGVYDYYRKLAQHLSKKRKMTAKEVEIYLDILKQKYSKEVTEFTSNFINEFNNKLTSENNNISFHSITMTGGGTLVLLEELKKVLPNVKAHENPLFANNLGNKTIAELKKLI